MMDETWMLRIMRCGMLFMFGASLMVISYYARLHGKDGADAAHREFCWSKIRTCLWSASLAAFAVLPGGGKLVLAILFFNVGMWHLVSYLRRRHDERMSRFFAQERVPH